MRRSSESIGAGDSGERFECGFACHVRVALAAGASKPAREGFESLLQIGARAVFFDQTHDRAADHDAVGSSRTFGHVLGTRHTKADGKGSLVARRTASMSGLTLD